MEQYKVLCDFYDSQDGDKIYKKGDLFPVEGSENEPSEERLKALGSTGNGTGIALIELPEQAEAAAEKEPEKATVTAEVKSEESEESTKKATKKAKPE